MVAITAIWREIADIDTRDMAITAGAASVAGGICSALVPLLLPYVDKNLAIFIAGAIGGVAGLWLSRRLKKGR